MTFYWWSHWFWITCLSVLLLPDAIRQVHTYPSHEISPESTTQQEERTLERTEADGRRQTTKLYQTTSSQTWSSVTQRNIMDLTVKTTAPARITPAYAEDNQQQLGVVVEDIETPFSDSVEDGVTDSDDDDDDDDENANGNGNENANGNSSDEANVKLTLSHNQFEFKRSADFATVPEGVEQLDNYTNFSTNANSNKSSSSIGCNTTCSNLAAAAKSSSANVSSTTVATSASTKAATAAKATTMGARSSTTTSTTSPPINSTGQALPATPSTPKINTEWLSDELQRAPFTLENANKEDELRRAESEHRSRKSKVLSAEYKHINRYINFSGDTKSLLTRSASAAPSITGYDADEGNISSEALAIQRTYFLDAGAISAICFTVFGICCTVGTIGIVLYRRRYLNKPQALSEPDSSVYIDDSTMRVSDNSDEMYSLDNDSFLNSLEAMTIQNYWTDTVKHTKL